MSKEKKAKRKLEIQEKRAYEKLKGKTGPVMFTKKEMESESSKKGK